MTITRKFHDQLYEHYRQHGIKLLKELEPDKQSLAARIYPNLSKTEQPPKQFQQRSEKRIEHNQTTEPIAAHHAHQSREILNNE